MIEAAVVLLIDESIRILVVMLLITANGADIIFAVGMRFTEPDIALGAGTVVAFTIHIHDGGVGHIVGVIHAAAGFADTVYKVMLFLDPLFADGAAAGMHIPEGAIIVYFMFVGGVAAESADIIITKSVISRDA